MSTMYVPLFFIQIRRLKNNCSPFLKTLLIYQDSLNYAFCLKSYTRQVAMTLIFIKIIQTQQYPSKAAVTTLYQATLVWLVVCLSASSFINIPLCLFCVCSSDCSSVCLSVCLFICMYVNHQSFDLPVFFLSFCLFIYFLPVCLAGCLFVCYDVCLFVCLYVCQFVRLAVCLLVC